jgi:hypothetical protein
MSITKKIFEEIRKEMINNIIREKDIIDPKKNILDYLQRLDAVELTKKYGCTLDEAIDTIDMLQKPDEVKKITMMLELKL